MISNRKQAVLFSFLLIAITSLTFFPSLFNQMTSWDDQVLVTHKEHGTDLSWSGVQRIFTSHTKSGYIPLTILSYTVEHHFFGLNVFAYHITNLILHILNVLLVFWLLRLLTKHTLISFVTTLLFAINPLQVESVASISARKEVLYAFFFLSSLIAYVCHIEQNRRNPLLHLLSFILFILSMLAKPQAIVLPLVLISLDYLFDTKSWKFHLASKLPFIGISIINLAAGQWALTPYVPQPSFYSTFNFLDKFFLTVYSIFFYIGQCLVPIRVCCLYPYPLKINHLFPWGVYIAPAVLGVISFLIYKKRKEDKTLFWASLFFGITLSVVLTNIWLGGYFAADHYMYIPSIGLFLALVCLAFHYGNKKLGGFRTWNIILISIYVLFLCTLSVSKCFVWKNDITLWSDVIDLFPNTPIAYNNRGAKFMQFGEFQSALDDFNQGIRLYPLYKDAYINRAILYADTGQNELAILDYDTIIKLDSRRIESYNNRGYIFFQEHKFTQALNDFNQALMIDPLYAQARLNRAQCYIQLQDYKNAHADLEYILKFDPRHQAAKELQEKLKTHLKEK